MSVISAVVVFRCAVCMRLLLSVLLRLPLPPLHYPTRSFNTAWQRRLATWPAPGQACSTWRGGPSGMRTPRARAWGVTTPGSSTWPSQTASPRSEQANGHWHWHWRADVGWAPDLWCKLCVMAQYKKNAAQCSVLAPLSREEPWIRGKSRHQPETFSHVGYLDVPYNYRTYSTNNDD